MNPRQPAWSSQFSPETIELLTPLLPLDSITREWAWDASTGEGVKVAVIDSGIDATHPAVGLVNGYVSISEERGSLVYNHAPHEDIFGHGNACAAIIRAAAPDCELYSIQVLGPRLTTRGDIFAAALRWAIDNGMHVCNLSLGTTKRAWYGMLHELSDLAYFRNVMLVTAANNLPVPSFPSLFASVISVASHAEKDPNLFYYNPHPPIEFGAFGIDVEVAWRAGSRITATGNSFAAPHITGIVARTIGKHPGITTFQMKVILRALAANVVASAPPVGAEPGAARVD